MESELGGFLLGMPDLSGTLLNFVELCSSVDVFGSVTEHAIDQTGYPGESPRSFASLQQLYALAFS